MDDDPLDALLRGLTPRQGPPDLDRRRVFGDAGSAEGAPADPPMSSAGKAPDLKIAPPAEAAPEPKAANRPWRAWWALPIAAALLIGVRLWPEPEAPDALSARGGGGLPALRVYRDRIAPENLLRGGEALPVGTRLFFELGGAPGSVVTLQAEGGEATPLGQHVVRDPPAPVRSGASSLLGWEIEPGRVVFTASTAEGCPPDRCVQQAFEGR